MEKQEETGGQSTTPNDELINEVRSLKQEVSELKQLISINEDKKPFEILYLPSQGVFYQNVRPYIFVNILTYHEEYLLTSPMLVENRFAFSTMLQRMIRKENGIDVNALLTCDIQAIILFLRSFSYGDRIEAIPMTCPFCEHEQKKDIVISNFKSRDMVSYPDENGELEFMFKGKLYKLKARTYIEDFGFEIKHKKSNHYVFEKLLHNLVEIDGERDKDKLLKTLVSMKIPESRELRKTVNKVLPGVDMHYNFKCESCEKSTIIDFGSSGENPFSMLMLPGEHRKTAGDEVFLISYYSQGGITIEEAKNMTVAERRANIDRIKDELEKKREAEKKATDSSKGSGAPTGGYKRK